MSFYVIIHSNENFAEPLNEFYVLVYNYIEFPHIFSPRITFYTLQRNVNCDINM